MPFSNPVSEEISRTPPHGVFVDWVFDFTPRQRGCIFFYFLFFLGLRQDAFFFLSGGARSFLGNPIETQDVPRVACLPSALGDVFLGRIVVYM